MASQTLRDEVRLAVIGCGGFGLFALQHFAQAVPKTPITLKGAPIGSVKFDHTSHLKVAAKCEVCHHASKPERPLKSRYEACTNCHTKPAQWASPFQ